MASEASVAFPVFGEVEGVYGEGFFFDVLPGVEFCPVEDGVDSHVGVVFGRFYVYVPHFGWLVLVVPSEVFVSGGESSFFGSDTVFVSSYGHQESVELLFLDQFFEGLCLEFSATVESSLFGGHSCLERVFVLGDDEVEVPFFGDFVSQLVDFWEFVACVDVDCWEWDLSVEGFFAEPEG